MKPLLLLLAIAAAGAYSYPSWHEQTATACQALDQRATLIANAESQGPMPFNLRPGKRAIAWMGDSGSQLIGFTLASLGLVLVASLIIGVLYPAFVQRFRVVPDEGRVQAPYIAHHLQYTRAG